MICAYWFTWNGNGSIVVDSIVDIFYFISYFDLIPWSSQVVPCVPSGGLVPLFPPVCPHGARCCPHPIIDHMAASTWHPSLVGCALHQDLKDYLNLSQSKNTHKSPLKVCTSTIFSSKKTDWEYFCLWHICYSSATLKWWPWDARELSGKIRSK